MAEEYRVNSFADLAKAFEQSPEKALKAAQDAMNKSLLLISGRLEVYPPSTSANRPGRWRQVRGPGNRVYLRPMGYYERRKGWWYPVMRKETLGPKPKKSAGAMTARRARGQYGLAGRGGVYGYKLIRSSQDLGKHWATPDVKTIEVKDNALVGTLGNAVTYAPYVQGRKQTKQHARTGWVMVDTALEQAIPDIEAAFAEAVDKLLKEL